MNRIISNLNNIRRVLVIHSIPTTVKVCFFYFYKKIMRFTPSDSINRAIDEDKDLEFDKKWGVNTSGVISPDKSQVVGNNWFYGQKYQGCNIADVIDAISRLQIHHEQFTFVDLGSGKGRALLVASSFPFKRIIGVEYSKQFHEIAVQNISHFPEDQKKCKEIEGICTDATIYHFPEGPLVICLNNPFGKPVMKEVVKNVLNSYDQNKRRIIVLYFNMEFAALWRKSGLIKETKISKSISIYDLQCP